MADFFEELQPLVETARAEAIRDGFQERRPTPLHCDFWGTSFAPSSSEVVFREMEARRPTEDDPLRIFTMQPCVRFADMAPFSDGVHMLHFHMFTCVASPADDPERDVRWFFDLLARLGAPVAESSFTYFPGTSPLVPKPEFPEFGLPLLERLEIGPSRRTACAGLANYQIDVHRQDTGNPRSAWGPRIEILADSGAPVEYGTLVYGSARPSSKAPAFPTTLCMVFGVERLAQVAAGCPTIWELPSFQRLQGVVLDKFFPGQPWHPIIGDVRHALELVLALVRIAEAEPTLAPGERGVQHQLRRIVQATRRSLTHVGIDARALLGALREHRGFALPPPTLRATRSLSQWLTFTVAATAGVRDHA